MPPRVPESSYELELHLVIVEIPIDEAADALLDRRAGPVAHVRDEILDVGPSVGNVALLHRQQVLLRLAPETVLEHLDVTHELDGLLVADVIDPIRRFARGRIWPIAVPLRIRGRDVIRRPHNALDDV